MNVRFRRLALATAVATLVLTTLGALVRGTGSGLGCLDDWPTCAGGLVPHTVHATIEFAHRMAAATVVALAAALVVGAVRWARDRKVWLWWSLAVLAVVVAQAGLGALVVTSGLHGALVTAHYVTALALVAITVRIAAATHAGERVAQTGVRARTYRMSLGAPVALFPLLVVGAYVRERGAGAVFHDWPFMDGGVLPSLSAPGAAVHFVHRLLALLVTGHVIALALRARRDTRSPVRALGVLGALLYLGQVAFGAANVWTTLSGWAVVAHASTSYLVWAAYVALAVVAGRDIPSRARDVPSPGSPAGFGDRVLAYVALTKPRIIVLLLVTTVPAMVLAAGRMPSLWLVAATLIGGMLTAGSANALNQYIERDIDELMHRTRSRPLPKRAVPPTSALVFAICCGVAGFVWLAVVANLLAASLAAGAIVFYVVVYTILLKRSTPQNIVIGGAAGAAPVLVGWAAVTGHVGAPAWVMFAIVFLWTPPHFWALAMRYRDDYERAGVPMLPVVRTASETAAQVLAYAGVLVLVSLVLSPVGGLGALYAVSATALGLGFVYRAVRLRSDPTGPTALKLFRYSITYLGLLFAAIAVDRLWW